MRGAAVVAGVTLATLPAQPTPEPTPTPSPTPRNGDGCGS